MIKSAIRGVQVKLPGLIIKIDYHRLNELGKDMSWAEAAEKEMVEIFLMRLPLLE